MSFVKSFTVNFCFVFLRQSLLQAGLKLNMYLRMTLNSSSCFNLLSARITGRNLKPSLCGARDKPKASSMLTIKPHFQSYSNFFIKEITEK